MAVFKLDEALLEQAEKDSRRFYDAIHSAAYWQVYAISLLEIIEMFCLDAEDQQRQIECMKYPGEQHERFALV